MGRQDVVPESDVCALMLLAPQGQRQEVCLSCAMARQSCSVGNGVESFEAREQARSVKPWCEKRETRPDISRLPYIAYAVPEGDVAYLDFQFIRNTCRDERGC